MNDLKKLPTNDIDTINLGLMEACGIGHNEWWEKAHPENPCFKKFHTQLDLNKISLIDMILYYWTSKTFSYFESKTVIVNYNDGVMRIHSNYTLKNNLGGLFQCELNDPDLVDKTKGFIKKLEGMGHE